MTNSDIGINQEVLGTSARIIELGATGSSNLGYLTVAEPPKNIPFEIERVYWTYFTPNDVVRGNHAHRELEQVLVAVSGHIHVQTESIKGEICDFHLMSPQQGLYVPRLHWRTLKFSHNAVLLSLASLPYDPDEYIRSYDDFAALKQLFNKDVPAL
ncbi:TDP-4-oxo-6-deoxy-alpha-D-glucose-3,4-oxoisomerase [compost metagenome]